MMVQEIKFFNVGDEIHKIAKDNNISEICTAGGLEKDVEWCTMYLDANGQRLNGISAYTAVQITWFT